MIPRHLLTAGLLWMALLSPAQTPGRRLEEYQVKAMYLGHIGAYTDRRDGAPYLEAGKPYRIGVVGKNPFEQHLATIYATQTVKKAKVKVVFPRTPEEAQECNMLFISRSEADRLEEILGWVKGRPVVTVGDTRGYAQRGVMVNFLLEKDLVNWEVNLGSLRKSGLVMDSNFLDLAVRRLEGGER
ncbi:MAG TPA: YfiR family protein [Holophagaceae bacterium]|nr:YfiR family protein [Holophagaceae bacterium]